MSAPAIQCDVAIVGAGPAGLGAAIRLRNSGVKRVVVLEREAAAGGIPRHCGHPPFGWPEFQRILKGPEYALRLQQAADAAGVDIRTETSVVQIEPGPMLQVTTPAGPAQIEAARVLLATGARETPRSARLISGTRPMGVLTTGALQSMVYLKSQRPFMRPVITGTELVSFSALLSCRHAKIRPVAMLEEHSRPTAWRASVWLPRLLGVRLEMNTQLIAIEGNDRVSGVLVRRGENSVEKIACDGVVFCGRFVAEASLACMGHIDVNPVFGTPVTDQFGRCSDARFFAAGNMVHPADTSGRCWHDGITTADHIVQSLAGNLPSPNNAIAIESAEPMIRYVIPQRLSVDPRPAKDAALCVRFSSEAKGTLHLKVNDSPIVSKRVRARPEKQVAVALPDDIFSSKPKRLKLTFEPSC